MNERNHDLLAHARRVAVDLAPVRARVLLQMVTVADNDGMTEQDMDLLADLTGLTTRSIREHLNALEYAGLLQTERTPRYRITLPDDTNEGTAHLMVAAAEEERPRITP